MSNTDIERMIEKEEEMEAEKQMKLDKDSQTLLNEMGTLLLKYFRPICQKY